MSADVEKNVRLTEATANALRQLANELHTSEGEVIRQGLEMVRRHEHERRHLHEAMQYSRQVSKHPARPQPPRADVAFDPPV